MESATLVGGHQSAPETSLRHPSGGSFSLGGRRVGLSKRGRALLERWLAPWLAARANKPLSLIKLRAQTFCSAAQS